MLFFRNYLKQTNENKKRNASKTEKIIYLHLLYRYIAQFLNVYREERLTLMGD